MNLAPRDRNNLMRLGAILMVAIFALSFQNGAGKWESERRIYSKTLQTQAEHLALIANRGKLEAEYDELASKMPVYPYEKDVAIDWLKQIDEIATESRIDVAKRQVGKEAEIGDVFELPVDFKNWSGTLKSLVTFLYKVNSIGAMRDVKDLSVQCESRKPGFLKGNFTLNCAYMRGEVEEAESGERKAESGEL